MEWNGSFRPFVSRPESPFSFLYNHSYDQHQGTALKLPAEAQKPLPKTPAIGENNRGTKEKKKRLTNDQLESLEKSFQAEIKLDPDRKMKLAQELGLPPRQIAVWFQNRRARWKAKQLERLYDSLKLEFDVVYLEKQKLQEEVMKLKAVVIKQGSTGYPELSGEETVESTSVAIRSSDRSTPRGNGVEQYCNYIFPEDEYNTASTSCWAVLPSNYP